MKSSIRLIFLLIGLTISAQSLAVTLKVGIFPRRGMEKTLTIYTPLIRYLAEKTGLDLELDVAPDMDAFWNRLRNGQYDIAHMNQYHYVRVHAEIGYQVILKNEEFGQDTIASAIWVRQDSPYKALTDLRDKWIVFGGGRHAMVASIMAKDLLQQAGLGPTDYFSRYTLYPLDALIGLVSRNVDAAGVGDVADRIPGIRKKLGNARPRILAKSQRVAHLPWAVRADLDKDIVASIKTVLLEMDKTSKGRALLKTLGMTGFREATNEEYDPHRKIILRVLGEDYFQPWGGERYQ